MFRMTSILEIRNNKLKWWVLQLYKWGHPQNGWKIKLWKKLMENQFSTMFTIGLNVKKDQKNYSCMLK